MPLSDLAGTFRHCTVPSTYVWERLTCSSAGRRPSSAAGSSTSATRLLRLETAGHWLSEEMPDVVASAILERIASA
jgi:pimeloyl-ACP methyl ester carboxylesterase